MSEPRCPACGQLASPVRDLLSGYHQAACLRHGRFVYADARAKPPLEDWPTPSTGDENSDEAADAAMSVAGAQRRRVLRELLEGGYGSEQDLEDRLHLAGNSVRPRLWELRRAGLIERVGKGTTTAGRSCWRYGVTDVGRRVVT